MGNFSFIGGTDDFLVQARGREIYESLIEETGADDFGQEIIDGNAGNMNELEQVIQSFKASVQTLPMFGSAKVVWLKDVSFLADTVTGRAKGTQELLESILKPALESLDPASVRVLLTASPVDRRRAFYKWIAKQAKAEWLNSEKDAGAFLEVIQKTAKAANVVIRPAAAELLIDRVSQNARLLQIEVQKLASYLGGEGAEITEEIINEMVPSFGEANFFEAAEVFYHLDLKRALFAIRRHFFTRPDARGLISNLQRMNRLMIQLRVLLDNREISNRVSKQDLEAAGARYQAVFGGISDKSHFNVFSQNPFYMSRLMQTASRVRLRKLIDFQQAFAWAFEEIIRRPNDQEAVMRETAIRCLG